MPAHLDTDFKIAADLGSYVESGHKDGVIPLCESLAVAVTCESDAAILVEHGAIQHGLKALELYCSDAGMVSALSSLLVASVRCVAGKQAFLAGDGFDKVSACISEHLGDPGVCRLLCELSMRAAENFRPAWNPALNGTPLMAQFTALMARYEDNVEVAEAAALAASELMLEAGGQTAFKIADGVPALVGLVRRYYQHAHAPEKIGLLGRRAMLNREAAAQFDALGGIPFLVRMLEANSGNATYLEQVAAFGWNVLLVESTRPAFAEAGGIQAMLPILTAHQDTDNKFLRQFMFGMTRAALSGVPLARLVFRELQGIDLCLDILRASPDLPPKILEEVVAVLANALQDEPPAQARFRDLGGVATVSSWAGRCAGECSRLCKLVIAYARVPGVPVPPVQPGRPD